jgi:hypothetical protein
MPLRPRGLLRNSLATRRCRNLCLLPLLTMLLTMLTMLLLRLTALRSWLMLWRTLPARLP